MRTTASLCLSLFALCGCAASNEARDASSDGATHLEDAAVDAQPSTDARDSTDATVLADASAIDVLRDAPADRMASDAQRDSAGPDASTSPPGYYVDCNAGSDALGGRTPATAVRTITRANALMATAPLVAGEGLYFRVATVCEGRVRPSITSPASASAPPVVFGAYSLPTDPPSAAPPIIDGSVRLVGWTRLVPPTEAPTMNGVAIEYLRGTPLFTHTPAAQASQLFRAGRRLPIAAQFDEANRGRITHPRVASIDQAAGIITPTNTQPLVYGHSDGMEVVLRASNYELYRAAITGVTPTQYRFDSAGLVADTRHTNGALAGWGMNIRNALPFVTSDGEWMQHGDAHPTSPRTITLYDAEAHDDIRASLVSAAGSSHLFEWLSPTPMSGPPSNVSIQLRDLTLRRSAGRTIYVTHTHRVTLERVTIEDAGDDGAHIRDCPTVVIDACVVRGSAGNGVLVSGATTASIARSTFEGIGFQGRQLRYLNELNAIRIGNSEAVSITDNTATGTGFGAVSIGFARGAADTATIARNTFAHACSLLNDCGAIYLNGSDPSRAPPVTAASALIEHNVVTDGDGNLDGVRVENAVRSIRGVYLDWRMGNSVVRANAFRDLPAENGAIFIHGGSNNRIDGNVALQTGSSSVSIAYLYNDVSMLGAPVPMSGNRLSNNTFVSLGSAQGALRFVDTAGALDANNEAIAGFNTGTPPRMATLTGNTITNLSGAASPMRPISNATYWTADHLANCDRPGGTCPASAAGWYRFDAAATSAQHGTVLVNSSSAARAIALSAPHCDLSNTLVSSVSVAAGEARVVLACTCNFDGQCNNRETRASCADCP